MGFENNRGIALRTKIIAIAVVLIIIVAGVSYLATRPAELQLPGGTEMVYPDHTKVDLATHTPFIGGVFLGIDNPWDKANLAAFKWYCGDVLGWKYEVVWPDADVAKQNDGAEMLIKKGVDALYACPLDSVANAKIGEMAREAGIPVVEFGIDMESTWPLAFFQRDDREAGLHCGNYIVNALKEKYGEVRGKILHIHGYRGSASDFLRSAGFIDAVSPYEKLSIIEVGNSWVETAEFPKIKAAMMANPDLDAAFEEMGGFHDCVVKAGRDLGWSEQKIKDLICACDDHFPVNAQGFKEGTQDYAELMPTAGYMCAPALETLKEFWKHGPEALPKIGDTFTVKKYVPELKIDATVDSWKPLQWFEDPVYGVSPTEIRPAPCGGYATPWVVIKDRIVTEKNYMEDFIYWNWPIWGLKS